MEVSPSPKLHEYPVISAKPPVLVLVNSARVPEISTSKSAAQKPESIIPPT